MRASSHEGTIPRFAPARLRHLGLATDKAQLDNRVRSLTAKSEALQQRANLRVPAEHLRKPQGIRLDRTKAGYIFAYQGGSGLTLVNEAMTEKWSPAAFFSANAASLGFQVGGQQSVLVILLMNTNATQRLLQATIEFGGAALKGGNISPDNEANQIYYGQFLRAKDILSDKKAKPTDTVTEFVKRLTEHSKASKK